MNDTEALNRLLDLWESKPAFGQIADVLDDLIAHRYTAPEVRTERPAPPVRRQQEDPFAAFLAREGRR